MVTTVEGAVVPALATEQMREVDRAMVEDLHIELVQRPGLTPPQRFLDAVEVRLS
jgi:hypothetical protein